MGANLGTACAELAGVAAGFELLGVPRQVSVPVAAVLVSVLVLRGRFHRVEHLLMALAAVFLAYVAAGLVVGPDWKRAATGLLVPTTPLDRDALLIVVATVGTTLAPWGLSFIQSYAVDKRLTAADLAYERVDVVTGSVLTGVIGFFVVVTCAETLHVEGVGIESASDAARALEPLAGRFAGLLFGVGLVGAASSPPRSCPCRPPTRSASSPAARARSTTASGGRRSSTRPSCWSPGPPRRPCSCPACRWSRCSC